MWKFLISMAKGSDWWSTKIDDLKSDNKKAYRNDRLFDSKKVLSVIVIRL